MLKCIHAALVLTCCKHDLGEETLSRGCCLAWCCGRDSGLSVAPRLVSEESAAVGEAASLKEEGML